MYKYFNAAKWLILFHDAVTQKYLSFMGRGILQGHGNKISRPFESSMITRLQLEFKNH